MEDTLTRLLATYPRLRPPLPEAYRRIYEREYKLNREGATSITAAAQKLEGWMHRRIARRGIAGRVLEIGAGTLNQVPYESATAYDVVEPFAQLYAHSPYRSRVRHIFSEISEVPKHNRYDRVISIAVLEHLQDLPQVVAQSALLLSPNGQLQHAIPSEGGLLWGCSWRATTGLAFRFRTGLSYRTLLKHEHISNAAEILAVIRYFFREVRTERFPLPWHHFSFYVYVEAADPRRERCSRFLAHDHRACRPGERPGS